MIQLSQIYPLNYQEEKEKFLKKQKQNPQFVLPVSPTEQDLLFYGKTDDALTALATKLIKTYLPYHLLNVSFKSEEQFLSHEAIETGIRNYLRKYNLHQRYAIKWQEHAIARCSIRKNEITIRSNADYTAGSLEGVLHHEIGTHALRRINDEMQPWHGKKNKYGFGNSLVTEEGLAICHQLLVQNTPISYNSAVRYVAVAFAQEHSFLELWNMLIPYVRSEEKRWLVCFRAKRGLSDTAKPGGYTKDKVYFEGLVKVSAWLATHDFNPTLLYLGKIAIEDVERARAIAVNDGVVPTFFTNDPLAYQHKIESIIDMNLLTS